MNWRASFKRSKPILRLRQESGGQPKPGTRGHSLELRFRNGFEKSWKKQHLPPRCEARLYDVCVNPLAQKVLDSIVRQEILKAGDRVGIAVSGGNDSVAMLRLLLELRGELGI